jgi:membrane-bound serine protease (ClpP class)
LSAVRSSTRRWRYIARCLVMGLLLGSAAGAEGTDPATLIELNGPIAPAMSRYVSRAMSDAAIRHSSIIILQMDTPGGLDTSMRAIIKAILASPVPVVTYVAPGGARAASAGTYILYASHFAAMAPATNLGAATPISIGGGETPTAPVSPVSPATPPTPNGAKGTNTPASTPESSKPPEVNTASERKAVNDAVAYIRSLAQLRGRNADWGESAVRGAASLSAQDALAQHAIDLIATDVPDLLRQLDGRKLRIAERDIVLHTAGAAVTRISPDWRDELLIMLTHPTIAYGLLLIGIYGLLLEGYNPGAVLPGVVGALSLVLALYAFELLAVNFAGVALLILGAGLIVLELFMPAFGSLGIGGLTAFVIGSILLFDNPSQGLHMALPLIVGIAIAGALVVAAITWLAVRARRRPVTTGAEAMVGEIVEVASLSRNECVVRYGGELWNAHASVALHVGQQARIVTVSGLTLWIEPA